MPKEDKEEDKDVEMKDEDAQKTRLTRKSLRKEARMVALRLATATKALTNQNMKATKGRTTQLKMVKTLPRRDRRWMTPTKLMLPVKPATIARQRMTTTPYKSPQSVRNPPHPASSRKESSTSLSVVALALMSQASPTRLREAI